MINQFKTSLTTNMNEEQLAKFELEWKGLDTNGDGFIDKAEVQALFRDVMQRVPLMAGMSEEMKAESLE